MKEKARSYLFDNYKALLIYFVVVGHTLSWANKTSPIYPAIYYFIYFFHMPAFMFISGYFSKNVDKCREKAVRTLLVPYLLMNILCYIQGYYVYTGNGLSYPSFQIFQPIRGCWFLFCLFIYKMFLKDLVRVRYILVLSLVASLAMGWSEEFSSYFSLSRLVAFSFYFLLGYFVSEDHINKIRQIPKWTAIAVLAAGAWFAWYVTSYKLIYIECILFRYPYRQGHQIQEMGIRLMLYGIALLMTAAWLILMSDKQTWYSRIGQNSVVIYVIHLFITRWLKDQSWVQTISSNKYSYGIYILLVTIVMTYVLSLPVFKKVYDCFLNGINKILFVKSVDL